MTVVMFSSVLTAYAVPMPLMPPSTFPDTEVVAHQVLDQTGPGVRRLDFRLSFYGTPSNNVAITFGVDADHDGELSFAETELVIGWRCGGYYIENCRTGDTYRDEVDDESALPRVLEGNWAVLRRERTLQSFTVMDADGWRFADLSAACPDWLYCEKWDLMRLSARGLDDADARFRIEVTARGFSINLR